ncbi:endonuclease [Jannaschia pagri]|uniref:Endonuclease n=1 Tax=Jannaschia pagri TaxID=2829797 RepID=A0ABQ4NG15_9RHOB|nr:MULTISPECIES: endonuclease/exonuclease/phosphatase family protein [unclassified Jannaschia]GIT90511.1 endonuclease [Jannaschia sp. AI_61]GIT93384.1 endonuclease [Jannaschia sp. AI_62]
MRVATFNLYQFLEPPNHWYERKDNGRSTHTEDAWQDKTNWIGEQLLRTDADVVAFQEVFSIEALRVLCEQAGYPHFATASEPVQDPEDPEVFFNPVVAIASRFPILRTDPVTVDEGLKAFLPVEDDFSLSRPPVCVVVDTPDFGEVTVYGVHLKSKRPKMDGAPYPDDMPWRDRVYDTMRQMSRGHVWSMLQRGAEAAALYLRAAAQLEAEETRPIIVLGDLNDDSRSVALRAITMADPIYDIGGLSEADWPPGTKAHMHRFRLKDAFHLWPNESGAPRPGTYIFRQEWSTLDYILLSDVFSDLSPNSIGRVTDFDVLTDHMLNDGVGKSRQSDHGIVVAEITPKAQS